MKNIIYLLLLLNILHAEVEVLSSNVPVTDSVNQDEEKRYQISVLAGDELSSKITNLEQDADIYVKIGSLPTERDYDCRSVNGGTNEDNCSIIATEDTEVFVTVYGFKSTSYTLTSSIETQDDDSTDDSTDDSNDDSTTDINLTQSITDAVEQGVFKYYKVSAETEADLNSQIKTLSADADIYVKIGEKPTKEAYDCRSVNGATANDSCHVSLENNDDVYVGVYGYRATEYTIIIESASNEIETLISGVESNGTLARKESKSYKIFASSGITIRALLSNLSADLDLYIKIGSEASRESYDIRSINGKTNDENYEKLLESDADIYFNIYAYKAGNYSFLVTSETIDITEIISINESQEKVISQGEMHYYKINEANQDIIALLSDLSSDLDLYLKIGGKPTTSLFDCKSVNTAQKDEKCVISGYQNEEDIFIGVYGYRAGNYTLTVNSREILLNPTVYEDGENGVANPAWEQSGEQSYPPSLFPTPDIEGASEGNATLVLVPHPSGNLEDVNYKLPINNFTQTILSMDFGGLPTYNRPYSPIPGFIVHYNVGVSVETLQGTRKMNWYSFFNHNNVEPFTSGASNTLLNYPSPAEQVRGYGYAPIELWSHFEVNLNEELQKLEPNNRIYKINYFYASGGFLDNIQFSLDTE